MMKKPDVLLPNYNYNEVFVREMSNFEHGVWQLRQLFEKFRANMTYADYVKMIERFEHLDDYMKHTRLMFCDVQIIDRPCHEVHNDN